MSLILDGTSGINTPNTFAYKNLLIDAGFTINQRGYVSAATLAAGVYGHDRWKAGASGGNYSFTQLASNTQITIASGKSLIQVVEDKNVSGTSYVLSWEGTAQARYAVNSATPAGSYAASPIVITGQTAGTTMSVEFNTGTLSKPQLELGAVATSFDQRAYSQELAMCQRYYWSVNSAQYNNVGLTLAMATGSNNPVSRRVTIPLPTPMRAQPTISFGSTLPQLYTVGLTNLAPTSSVSNYSSNTIASFDMFAASGGTAGQGLWLILDSNLSTQSFNASAEL